MIWKAAIAADEYVEKQSVSVVAQKHFNFLGFALRKNGKGVYVRVHRHSLAKAKRKLKELKLLFG